MKTIIQRDISGGIILQVEGDVAPQAVALEYLKVEEILFPKPDESEEAKGTPEQIVFGDSKKDRKGEGIND